MPYQEPHQYEIDRATSKNELVKVIPTRHFLSVPLSADGHWTGSPALYRYQLGVWYDTGGNEITDPERDVPERFRKEIAEIPLEANLGTGPAVTGKCKICGEEMNDSALNEHYLKHYHDTVARAGELGEKLEPTTLDKSVELKPKHDANRVKS